MHGNRTIKACLFDMDGTLINTEDIYTEVTNELLAKYGKGPMTWDVKIQLQGRPGTEAAQIVIDLYDLPCTASEVLTMCQELQQSKWPTCQFLPGALPLIEYLASKQIPIALGTSSTRSKYVEKTSHLHHGFRHFQHHVVTGDDPRILPGRGKPYPDIWLACLDSLNKERSLLSLQPIEIHECLVFEDGMPGVESGIAAKAHVIWIPDAAAIRVLDGREHEVIGDNGEILETLEEFNRVKYGL